MSIDKATKAQDFLNQLKRFKESIPLKIPPDYLYTVIEDEFLRFHTAGYKQGRVETLDELYQIFVNIHENVKNRFSDEAFLKLGKKIYDKFIIEKEGELKKARE